MLKLLNWFNKYDWIRVVKFFDMLRFLFYIFVYFEKGLFILLVGLLFEVMVFD